MILNITFPATVLLLLLFSGAVASDERQDIVLPEMGDSSGALISPSQEKELGEAFYRNLHSQLEINQDVELQEYIQSLGHRLVSHSDAPGKPFHFFVVQDNAINAFAGPGGYIGVNSGLILTTESESELASVMAHEIAHVTQRHLYRAFEAAGRMSIPMAAATLAAILIGTQVPELGQAALIAAQAGSVQYQIDFTRDNEQEADRVGMQTLARSDFDPNGMPVFFERLQQSSRYYGKNIPEFLRTHPVTASRISDTLARAEQYPYRQYPDSLVYQIAKTKLKAMASEDPNRELKHFRTLASQGTREQRAVARYGSGLIYLRLQQFKKAGEIFYALAKEMPGQPHFIAAQARTAAESRDYRKALQIFETARENFPENNAIQLEYISTLLGAGDAERARRLLVPMIQTNRQKPVVYKLLAQSYGALKQDAESHRYMAEYYYLTGLTNEAITQINLAKKSEGLNFYLSSILDERLAFFTEEEEIKKKNK
ncbi:MAG: M48 family metalloprotease [Gammaproteobacteria bacterium]